MIKIVAVPLYQGVEVLEQEINVWYKKGYRLTHPVKVMKNETPHRYSSNDYIATMEKQECSI